MAVHPVVLMEEDLSLVRMLWECGSGSLHERCRRNAQAARHADACGFREKKMVCPHYLLVRLQFRQP